MSGTPTPRTQRLKVEPLDQWGNLIKSWATQQNYIDTPFGEQPPRNYSTQGYPIPPPPTGTKPAVDAKGLPMPWALPPMAPVAIPRVGDPVYLPWAVALTVPEFRALLAAVQFTEDGVPSVLTVDVPTQYQHIIIVQGDANTMVLRLPPTDTLQGSEDDLINGVRYPIPDFYTDIYRPAALPGKVDLVPPTTRDKIMELHAYRIGEYTLNTCN